MRSSSWHLLVVLRRRHSRHLARKLSCAVRSPHLPSQSSFAAIAQHVEKPYRTCEEWHHRIRITVGMPISRPPPLSLHPKFDRGRASAETSGFIWPPPTGSSSDSHLFYPVGGSDAGGSSNFYLPSRGLRRYAISE